MTNEQWDEKNISLNDVLDCIYTWEETKQQHLAHSYEFYRKELKERHPLILRLKQKLQSATVLKDIVVDPEGKDWEIVAFEKDGHTWTHIFMDPILDVSQKDWESYNISNKRNIHSVKRKSDGEVFSVGDIDIEFKEGDSWFNTYRIQAFNIRGNELIVELYNLIETNPTGSIARSFSDIHHRKPQQSKRIDVKYAGRGQDGPQYIVEGMDEDQLRQILFKEGKLVADKETAEALSSSPHCKRVEVSDINNAGGVGIDGWYHYTFNMTENMSEDQLQGIRLGIEAAANPYPLKSIIDTDELKRLHFIEEAYAEVYELLKNQKRDDL